MNMLDSKIAMARIAEIDAIANRTGWNNINVNLLTRLVSYAKIIELGYCRIDVYFTTMTVSVALRHPKKGKTQLHRKSITDAELGQIFRNPRKHTGKGYYKKTNTKKSI